MMHAENKQFCIKNILDRFEALSELFSAYMYKMFKTLSMNFNADLPETVHFKGYQCCNHW